MIHSNEQIPIKNKENYMLCFKSNAFYSFLTKQFSVTYTIVFLTWSPKLAIHFHLKKCCILTLDRAKCSSCVNKVMAGHACINNWKQLTWIRAGRTLHRRYEIIYTQVPRSSNQSKRAAKMALCHIQPHEGRVGK